MRRKVLVGLCAVILVYQLLLVSLKVSYLKIPPDENIIHYAAKAAPSTFSTLSSFLTYPLNATITTSLDYASLQQYPLQPVACATHPKTGARIQFYMQRTFTYKQNTMIDWVCKSESEQKVMQVMLYVFSHSPPNSRMLDVGANTGFFSLLAMAMGHQAVQFDLQPDCLTILRNSNLVNGFQNRSIAIGAGVSDAHTRIQVPTTGCDGRFPASANKKKKKKQQQNSTFSWAELHPLNYFISPRISTIMMVKIDTEGNEQRVLAGAMEFFKAHKIRNAVVEVTPGNDFWAKAGITKAQVLHEFGTIVDLGYWMISLHDFSIHRTAAEAVGHLDEAEWIQADMWLTSEETIVNLSNEVRVLNMTQLLSMV